MLAVASALLLAAAPPEPTIDQAPPATTTTSSATFSFRGGGRVYDFQCKVGATRFGEFAPCTSPHTVADLPVGTHTFQVRAVEGTTPGVPATHTWRITAIDDDGDGIALPADCDDRNAAIHTGAIEVPNNGIDEDCSGSDHVFVIPPVTFPTPVPTATPTPAPQAKKPKISVTLSYFMNARKSHTRFSTLSVKAVPRGATVKVTCRGGCPRRSQTITKSGTVALTAYRDKAIEVGATLTIAVTKPGTTGIAKVVTIRSGKRPRITTKTLS